MYDIKIIHYNGKDKPWNVNKQRQIDKIWLKYYIYVYPSEDKIEKPIKKKKIINKNLLNYLSNKKN